MARKKYIFRLAVLATGLLVAGVFYLGGRPGSGEYTGPMIRGLDSLYSLQASERAPATAGIDMRKTARLSVRTEPTGALVVIESDSVGRSPVEQIATRTGVLLVSIQKPQYAPLDTIIITEEGELTIASFTLDPLEDNTGMTIEDQAEPPPVSVEPPERSSPPSQRSTIPEPKITTGRVQVTSEPAAAGVWIDGAYKGETPIALSGLGSGRHRLSVQESGYQPLHTTVRIRSGETSSLHASLMPAVGTLQILVKPWGSIYIDHELHKANTDLQYTIQLPVGTHHIRAVHPALGVFERTVQITGGNTKKIVANLNAENNQQ